MKWKGLLVLVVIIFLGLNFFPTNAEQIRNNSFTSTKGSTSNNYYTSFTGQKIWVAIRVNFSEPTNITVRFKHSSFTNYSTFALSSFGYSISINGTPIISSGGVSQGLPPNPDRYLKIKYGNINWNYSHNSTTAQDIGGYSSYWWNLPNCTGYYDFTLVAYCYNTTIEAWIATSNNATFSMTHGNEVFTLQRNNFNTPFNIGGKTFTFIKNGTKQVTINNTLFAWFSSDPGSGYQRFEYQTPTGNQAWRKEIDFRTITLLTRKSDAFDSGLLWGPKGTWTFTINFWEMLPPSFYCPNLFLIGADVTLPN
jgi:hypothetical protein